MGSVYYTSSASDAEKHYARNTDYKYNAREAYFRIESAALYTLHTEPEDVTAKTNGTSDTRFYADEMVTVTAPADTETTKFEKWTFSGTEPTGLPNGWETSKEFTFKMPASNVTLGASYHTITKYEVKVNGGTIVDGSGTGKNTGSFEPGTEVTIQFTESDDITKQFKQWTYTGTAPEEPKGGWTAANDKTSKTFTFKMPEGNVTLKADYKTVYTLTVAGGTIGGKAGMTTGSFQPGDEVTVVFDDSGDIAKQFKQWTYTGTAPEEPKGGWTAANDKTSKTFTFKMPEGNVTLKADYKTVYTLTVDDGKGTILVNGVAGNRALAGDQITVTETGSDEHHLFSSWELTSSTPLVHPSDNWQTSKEFTFTMPAGNVSLKADYKQLYDLTVTGGTIVDGSNPGKTTGIYLPDDEVTVCFTDSDNITEQFKQWTYTGTAPVEPDGGWTAANDSTSKTFTFKMPKGNVTLEAEYKTVYNVSVGENRGTVLVNDEERTQALEGETVTVKASDTFFDEYHEFDGWQLSGDSATPVNPPDNWKTSKEFTFTMPAGNVTLKADYKQLYDLTVTGGTIVDGNGDTGIYLPGTEVTIAFTESDEITEQFKQWKSTDTEPEAPTAGWPEGGWQNSKKFTFKMPYGDVSLSAVYRETYRLYETAGKAEFFVDGQKVYQAPAGVCVTVKLVDGFNNDHLEFDQWRLGDISMELVNPDEGWQHKPCFSFTMPEGEVELQAHTTSLYDVNVTHGTIVDETGDTGTSQKIVKPGQLVTVRAESTEENPFQKWNCTGTAPAEPDDGWPEGGWQTSQEFTFKMPYGDVTLEAQRDQLYKVSIKDNLGSVTINGEPRSSLWVKEGETVTVATTLKDGYWMEFEKWNAQDGSAAPVEPDEGWQTSTAFTFKMPNGPVELMASWKGDAAAGPDEPFDEDFGVEPAPMDTTGGTIAAVAVGGAAIWGGYEIATRVILHSLLPEGAAIPANRGQLALLVWNAAGRPEPAAAPAFADVADTDMAKAVQWCTEQGILDAKGDRFEPEGWTPKFKVIEVWNKAFPAA